MPCSAKILKRVKKQYPHYSLKRQEKITWSIMFKQRKRRKNNV